eukprot:TRINITY_DN2247_c0_g1_i2.p1 TRINITY_DN2247_c0_g1~~TRINITY_DN2247_c0_g1_i2.p1  ORF type:complete len:657 (+),score=249.55 TRINITY_DN2247_c0_g1_i2:25-1995(+)
MSGWGGWGNWISSTVNSVVKEFGDAMKDLDEDQLANPNSQTPSTTTESAPSDVAVDSNAATASQPAKRSTRKVVADGASKEEIEITDGDEDEQEGDRSDEQPAAQEQKLQQQQQPTPSATSSSEASKADELNPEGEKKEREEAFVKEEEILDSFENALDQGAAFLTTTTSFLGGLLQQGIDIVKNSEEVAFLSVQAKSVANTSKKIVEDVTSGSLNEGLEASQTVALNALEAVGKKAFTLLTTTTGDPEKPRLKPIYMAEQFDALRGNSDNTVPETPVVKEDSLAHFFDEALGSTHEKAIELLSSNCLLMTQKKQRLLSPEELTAFNAMIAKIQHVFENEDEIEDVAILEERVFSVTLNSKVSNHREKLLELENQILKHIFERANAPLNQSGKEGLSRDVVLQDFHNLVSEIRKDSMRHFGEFSAGVVEQIMRVAESYLIVENEKVTQQQAHERAIEKANYIHSLTVVLSSHIGKITSAYINCLQQISQAAIEELSQIGGESSEPTPSQIIEEEVSTNSNAILFDSSEASSYISDAEKMAVNICKWLLLSWKEEEPEPAVKNEEKEEGEKEKEKEKEAEAPATEEVTKETEETPVASTQPTADHQSNEKTALESLPEETPTTPKQGEEETYPETETETETETTSDDTTEQPTAADD